MPLGICSNGTRAVGGLFKAGQSGPAAIFGACTSLGLMVATRPPRLPRPRRPAVCARRCPVPAPAAGSLLGVARRERPPACRARANTPFSFCCVLCALCGRVCDSVWKSCGASNALEGSRCGHSNTCRFAAPGRTQRNTRATDRQSPLGLHGAEPGLHMMQHAQHKLPLRGSIACGS